MNPLTAYLKGLEQSKPGLPFGVLVAACASPTINTTEGLLKLADAVGAHIAILQCHSDIIDDWSSHTVHELTRLARKHGFILWEGGRLLNSGPNLLGKNLYESRERFREYVDYTRRSYTKGSVSVASWACLVSSWVSPVPPQKQYTDILIPILKGAARETIAKITQIIRTEITVDRFPPDPLPDLPSPTSSRFPPEDDFDEVDIISRRASTISLTRSITQHSEPSPAAAYRGDPRRLPENAAVEERMKQYTDSPATHSPPLLARGVMLCLPAVQSSPFLPWYRKSVLAAARANRDFVVGFLCNEPWTLVSRGHDIWSPDLFGAHPEQEDDDDDEGQRSWRRDDLFIMISPLPANINRFQPAVYQHDSDSDDAPDRTPALQTPPGPLDTSEDLDASIAVKARTPQAQALHATVARALAARNEAARNDSKPSERTDPKRGNGPKILHIPLITLTI
jgi:hypothetical protein